MKTIVALDPGGTTGIATLSVDKEQDEVEWNFEQFGPDDHHFDLYKMLNYVLVQNTDMAVVCESFEYRNRSREGLVLASVEYIGVVKLFCEVSNVPLYFQMAAEGKVRDTGFVSSNNIKRLGLWLPGKKHAMDACGHLLYALAHKDLLCRKFGLVEYASETLQKGWKA